MRVLRCGAASDVAPTLEGDDATAAAPQRLVMRIEEAR
jgi:hypothetical protein